jgi:hypothetical protein
MIADARQKGASVVVCSPVPRNVWTGEKVVRQLPGSPVASYLGLAR